MELAAPGATPGVCELSGLRGMGLIVSFFNPSSFLFSIRVLRSSTLLVFFFMSIESHFFYLFENSLLYLSARNTLSGFPALL